MIALHPQRSDESLAITEKNSLSFPVLSDPGNQIATVLGIKTRHSEKGREAALKIGTDWEKSM